MFLVLRHEKEGFGEVEKFQLHGKGAFSWSTKDKMEGEARSGKAKLLPHGGSKK